MIVGVASAAAPTAPAADAQPLAILTARTPVSAGSGWIVWSARQGARWRLTARHAGVTRRLAIAGRFVPFDADVGTDRRGRAVATFSRCESDPQPGPAGGRAWWLADGCRLRVVDLAGGRERPGGVRRPVGASDSTPSMCRGRIAFARRPPPAAGRGAAGRALRRHHRRLRALPGRGAGAVEGLDLGSRLVAVVWYAPAGTGGWQVVAGDPAGHAHEIDSGFIGEACTGSPDFSKPSTPAVAGWVVTYTQLTSSCYQDSAVLVRTDVRADSAERGPLAGDALEASWWTGPGVALVAPPGTGPDWLRCDRRARRACCTGCGPRR